MLRQARCRRAVIAALLLAAALSVAPSVATPQAAGSSEAATAAEGPRFVAYYFHGNVRCATCRKLEAYSEEAITTGFADELERGALAYQAVNVDEDQNKHFVRGFQLTNKSVVLVEYRDGKVARFENLNEIWQRVRDKDDFLKYVRDSTREFIGES